MKKHKWFSIISIMSGFLLSVFSTVEAIPPLPSSFYGNVRANGDNIPEGTILKAVINGEVYALTIVEMFEGESVYSLDVPGDDPTTTTVVEGGSPGDMIQFIIGDNPAIQIGSWVSGTNIETDLVFEGHPLPIMPASFYGTVKINNENVSAGTIISAVINDVIYVDSNVYLFNGSAVYSISVPGDDTETPGIIEGGVNGDIVQFLINSTPADQIVTWVSESNTEVNLTATISFEQQFYYFPLINK